MIARQAKDMGITVLLGVDETDGVLSIKVRINRSGRYLLLKPLFCG